MWGVWSASCGQFNYNYFIMISIIMVTSSYMLHVLCGGVARLCVSHAGECAVMCLICCMICFLHVLYGAVCFMCRFICDWVFEVWCCVVWCGGVLLCDVVRCSEVLQFCNDV